MLFKRYFFVLGILVAGLAQGHMLADSENGYAYKKWATKLAGATVGGAAGYGFVYKLLPFLFNKTNLQNSDNFGKYFAEILRLLTIGGFVYGSAECAWWLMPEGKIENSKNIIKKYELLLSTCAQAGDNLFDILDALYVGNDMALLVAYRDINYARSQLCKAEACLSKLVDTKEFATEVTDLLSKVKSLRVFAEQTLIMIVRHPQYVQFKQIEEMRLGRQQPTIHYQYHLN